MAWFIIAGILVVGVVAVTILGKSRGERRELGADSTAANDAHHEEPPSQPLAPTTARSIADGDQSPGDPSEPMGVDGASGKRTAPSTLTGTSSERVRGPETRPGEEVPDEPISSLSKTGESGMSTAPGRVRRRPDKRGGRPRGSGRRAAEDLATASWWPASKIRRFCELVWSTRMNA